MAIAFVAAWTGVQDVDSNNATLSNASLDTTGGNFVVAAVTSNLTVTSVTDNKSNSYTLLGPFNASGGDNLYIAYTNTSAAATCGTGHILTVTASGNAFNTISAAAYSGLATSGVLDKSANSNGTGTSLTSTATASTAQANELLIGAGTLGTGSNTSFTAGGSFTMRSQIANGSLGGLSFLEEQIVAAISTYTATATCGASGGWDCAIATFKAVASGSTTQKTMTDTLSVSDSNIDYLRRVRVTDDLLTISDSIVKVLAGGGVTTTKVLSDTVAVADGIVEWLRRNRNLVETVTITDDPNRIIQLIMDDLSIETSDELLRSLSRGRVSSETISVTDSAVQWRRLARLGQDSLTVIDAFSKTVLGSGTVYAKVLTDTLDVPDGVVEWRRLRRVLQDNADLLDGFTKILAGAGITYVKVLTDSVTLIDDNGQRWTLRKSQLSDTVTITDEVRRALARIAILGENVEVNDGVVRILRAVRVSTEPLEVGDELVRQFFPDQVFTVAIVFGSTDPFRFGGH